MRGVSDVPELHLEVLQKLVTTFQSPPSLVLSSMFGDSNSPSDTVKWESQEGSRGLTPFNSPGVASPRTSLPGVAEHEAVAAYWSEKNSFR